MSLYELKTWEAITPLYRLKWLSTIPVSEEILNSMKMYILFSDNRLKYVE